ncbi:MAG: protein kinase [Planctomycetota bacterium]|nr:protein kinase [Planctomycetota bacterium]
MDPHQWKRVRELFEACLDEPESQQGAFLDAADAPVGVIEEAKSLLESSRQNLSAFEPPTPALESFPNLDPLDITRGTTIGHYTVEGRIGSGGMADVFVATQDQPSRKVAIKVMRGQLSERAVKRFQFESEVLGQLSHPSIAQVFDAGEAELAGRQVPFIAMEYVEGAEDVIHYARRSQLDLRGRLEVFLGLSDAIRYGHENGVLHRDIKPSNLLISKDGQPKVIDYGIARAENQLDSDRTMTGEIFGTIGYIAPERLRSSQRADTRSEVYSLGVVLFELVTGRPPMDTKGLSFVQAVDHMERQEPPRASSLAADVPEGIDWVCFKALANDRDRRYSSVAELIEDIRRYLSGETVLAGAPSTSYRMRSWLRRHRALASLVLLGLVGTIATIVGTNIGLQRAETKAELARTQTLLAEKATKRAERETARAESEAELAKTQTQLAEEATLLAERETIRAESEAKRAETEATEAKRQASVSATVLNILEETLKKANATHGGVDARVSEVLEAIDARVDKALANEPEIANRMDSLLATAYLGSRDIPSARRILERASERPETGTRFDTELKVADAYIDQLTGRLPEAEEKMRGLVELTANADTKATRTIHLDATRGLIAILLSMGKAKDALAVVQAVNPEIRSGAGQHARTAFLRIGCDVYRMNGQMDKAMESVQQSMELARTPPEDSYELITGLRSAGALELQRGRTKSAGTFLEEAASKSTEFLGVDHPETALTGVVLSEVYVRLAQYDRAIEEYDRIEALPAFGKLTLRNRIMQADTRAYVLANMHKNEEALAAAEKAVGLLNASIAEGDPVRLSCQAMRARLLIQLDRVEEGLSLLEELNQLATRLHGPHSRTAVSMQQELTQGYKTLGNFEKVIKITTQQIADLSDRMEPDQTHLWNARQLRIEALVELGRWDEAQTAIDELRTLVDLEKSPGRKLRIDKLEAITAAKQLPQSTPTPGASAGTNEDED